MRYATNAAMVLCLAAGGCALEAPDRGQQSFPSAGLYAPGNTLGASDPTDTPQPGAGLGNRCVSLPPFDPDAGVATEGTLHLEYTTTTLMGRYWPRNCTAVWIETPAGQYVATIELTAKLRRPGLVYWQERACTDKLGPDAVTSATLPNHDRPHAVTWSGRDFEEKPVPDGVYKLFIEVTETDKDPGELTMFEFTKSSTPYPEMPLAVPAEGPLTDVKIEWELMREGNPGGAIFGQ